KPLTTLLLPTWQLFEKYNAPAGLIIRQPSLNAINSLSVQQQSRLRNGSTEERLNTLNSLDANTRRLVLTGAQQPILEGLPQELQQESAKLKQEEQQELQKERQKLMP